MLGKLLLVPLLLNSKTLTKVLFGNNTKSSDSKENLNYENKNINRDLEWNIVTHNFVNNEDYYELFNPNGYSIRDGHLNRGNSTEISIDGDFGLNEYGVNDGETTYIRNGYNPNRDEGSNNRDIIGSDDRILIQDPSVSPYNMTGIILSTYDNVPVISGSEHPLTTVYRYSTGFIMGANVVITAAHSVFEDVTIETTTNQYNEVVVVEDNVDNPRFPDSICFFPGEIANPLYLFPEYEAIEVSIHKSYYLYDSNHYDWAAIMTSNDVGGDYGWYPMQTNWFTINFPIYSYGYHQSSSDYFSMYNSPGIVMEASDFRYTTNLDVVHGNSGGPIFYNSANAYGHTIRRVVGIVTSGIDYYTYGVKFTNFIGAFICSFMQSYWPGC